MNRIKTMNLLIDFRAHMSELSYIESIQRTLRETKIEEKMAEGERKSLLNLLVKNIRHDADKRPNVYVLGQLHQHLKAMQF